jgi:tRNA(fMet)-specific endonuclease VapC
LKQSYVLDTNILLALIRGKALGESIDNAYGLRANLQRHVVSIASQAELLVLADRNNWAQAKRDVVNIMFENLVVLPIDGRALVDAYVAVSRVDLAWPDGPRNMGKNDIWIAATAVSSGLPLLTTDKDFRFLNGNLAQVLWIDPDHKSDAGNAQ